MGGFVGIDLAGSERRPSGWAFIDEDLVAHTILVYRDEGILRKTLEVRPSVVAIDAPLSHPKSGHFRKADLMLKKIGYSVLPTTFSGMSMLTERGIRLAEKLREHGVEVIETHPRSARKAMGIDAANPEEVQKAFLRLGIRGALEERKLSPHELDALTAAYTALAYVEGNVVLIGDSEEGYIVLPRGVIY